MLSITIKTIPHYAQRYNTVGDWTWSGDGQLYISVSDMKDEYKELLVAIHELVEVYLCRKRGITEDEVTQFDLTYEKDRKPEDLISEPGDSRDAPYRNEHRFATYIERAFCKELGIKWEDYEKTVYSL